MTRQLALSAVFALMLPLASFVFADEPATEATVAETPTKLKGLLITGGCCHDYLRQTKIITEGFSQRMSISWDVVHEANKRDTKVSVFDKKDWAKGYDIVVHNECYGGVKDVKHVENIVKGHTESGVPAVVIHCAMHSYRDADTDEWRKFLGVKSRRHEKGGVKLDVTNRAVDHPIMTSFPKEWTTPNGELYVIENMWDSATPLATAYGVGGKKDQVCMWINTYGKSRVFGVTLGHHNETMASDEWLDTVSRGALWSMAKLQDDGSPAEGYEGTGKGPLSFQRDDGPQPTPATKPTPK